MNKFLAVPLTHLIVTVVMTVLVNAASIAYFFGGQIQEIKTLRMDVTSLQAAISTANVRYDTLGSTLQTGIYQLTNRVVASETKLDLLIGQAYQHNLGKDVRK